MPQADIHFEVVGSAGRIVLDRPKALNALSQDIIRAFTSQLNRWRDDRAITHVVIASSAPRAFCAGGDIRFAREVILAGQHAKADQFFRDEYLGDLAVAEFGKPVIALADGVVMGGGAGLACHASHVVVTETTRFAMPESGIGLFPDAGASLFFGRCPRPVARLLGMIGHGINGADCLLLGLATAMVPSDDIAALQEALLRVDASAVDDLISDYSADSGAPSLAAHRPRIDHIFADGLSPEAIRDRAGDVAQLYPDDRFVGAVAAALSARCPMSIKVFCRMMDVARDFTQPAEALALEFQLAMRMIRRDDFVEGIRAVVVDKDQSPKWQPDRLEAIDAAMLDAVFDGTGLPPLR
jgi:enoyl-CoA hydratase